VRTIDDISFRLKATLIQAIGNLRISRSGLRALVSEMTAVLEPLRQREVIESYLCSFQFWCFWTKTCLADGRGAHPDPQPRPSALWTRSLPLSTQARSTA